MSLALIVLALAASIAHAESPPAKTAPHRRKTPVYDGRVTAESTTAGDVAHAVGQVVLFPFYVVVQYGLRKPIGFLVRKVEQSRTARGVFHYLFRGPATPTPSVYPVAFYDFGFVSSLGVRMAWKDGFATPGSSFHLKLGFGGSNWYRAETQMRVQLPAKFRAVTELIVRRRPDQIFHGIGSRTPQEALARYALSRTSVEVGLGWRGLGVYTAIDAQGATASTFSGDASIPQQVAAGRIATEPSGYNELLTFKRVGARLGIDTRDYRVEDGARLDATLERAGTSGHGAWTRFEAIVGAALRLDPVNEYKLDVKLRLELVEPDDGADVPFLDLVSVGGSRDLRGFGSGRGRDESALALTVDYQWPIAAWLDATAYVGLGNVFGHRLAGFYTGKLRGSFGTGLAFTGFGADRQLELWTAVGTDPLDEGLDVSSFRLALGYSHDY